MLITAEPSTQALYADFGGFFPSQESCSKWDMETMNPDLQKAALWTKIRHRLLFPLEITVEEKTPIKVGTKGIKSDYDF